MKFNFAISHSNLNVQQFFRFVICFGLPLLLCIHITPPHLSSLAQICIHLPFYHQIYWKLNWNWSYMVPIDAALEKNVKFTRHFRLYCTLYHQRTFISPKNFYIPKELLYHQSAFISPNNFYQRNKIIKFFAPEFMVIQDNCGPTLLRGLPPGTPSLRKRFESSAYSGSWIRGG